MDWNCYLCLFFFFSEVQQYFIKTSTSNNDESNLQRYKQKFQAVEKILSQVPFYQGMIFVNSLPRSMELSRWLNEMGWKAGHIHAGISQDKRLSVMEDVRDFKLRILVCSDLVCFVKGGEGRRLAWLFR